LIAGICAIRAGRNLRIVGIALLALVTIEFSLGVAAVVSGLPIGVAVAHNWIAALLILTTIKLLSESQAGSG
jgi:heme A synthase